jgi:hypothetical protein
MVLPYAWLFYQKQRLEYQLIIDIIGCRVSTRISFSNWQSLQFLIKLCMPCFMWGHIHFLSFLGFYLYSRVLLLQENDIVLLC